MKTFFRLIQFSKPYHHYVPEYLVYILLFTVFNLLNISLIIPLLNALFNSTDAIVQSHLPAFSFTLDYFKELFNFELHKYVLQSGKFGVLLFVCIIIVICVILKNLFAYLSQRVLTRMRTTLLMKLRESIHYKYLTQSLSFYHNEKKGDLLSIISGDVVEIENTVVSSIQTMMREPFILISTFCMLFYLSKELTLFTLVFFPISGFMISSISRKLRKKAGHTQELLGKIVNISEETISGIRIIKSFTAEKFVGSKFREENYKFSRSMKSIVNQRELASPLSEILGVIVIVVIIVYGGNLIMTGRSALTASEFIAYIVLYFQIIAPAKNIASAFSYLQRGLAAGERVLRVVDSNDVIKEAEHPKAIAEFNSAIEFKDVCFRYNTEQSVLEHINLKVDKGTTIALVGMSGAGKSTLVDLIPRFYDITEGEILINNQDIRTLKLYDLRKLISIVSQEAILFNDSILNNIAFGINDVDKQDVIDAAKAANAHNFIMEMENGYDTNIGDRGSKLSGGQRQRITIARAILKNAPILILDEATSALDTESEKLVQDAINNMMQNRTSIVIAHRLSTVRHADEIIVLQKGTIAERGTHEILMQKESGLYKRLIEMQEVK